MRHPSMLTGLLRLGRSRIASPHQRRRFAATHQPMRPSNAGESQQARVQLRLRQYQEDCISSVLSHLDQGRSRLGISLATGSGKTVIFTQLIDRIRPGRHGARQTLILAHRRELVEQASRHCQEAYPDKTIDIEMGKLHASGSADITVASVRSLASGDRMAKFDAARYKLVLVDEAHHIVAPEYLAVLDHFGLGSQREGAPALVGVSATLSRFDGRRLGAALDHIVYHKDYVDMIEEGWLCDVLFTTVRTQADLSRVRKARHGDFLPAELSRAVNTAQANDITVRAWLARARGRRSTMVFCVDVGHVVALTEAFRRHGVDARFVTGQTPTRERQASLEAFRRGDFAVLVNCGVFTEGTDVPNIDCIVLARPTRSRNLLVQMIGRGMRLHPGKKDCHVIDMVASLTTGIVTTPTLFGLDPDEMVEQADAAQLRQRQEVVDSSTASHAQDSVGAVSETGATMTTTTSSLPSTVTLTDYDSVVDLIEDTSGERHIRAISTLAWVQVGPGKYILNFQRGDYLSIIGLADDRYEIRLTSRIPGWAAKGGRGSPFMKPRLVAEAITFLDAVHAADTYARESQSWNLIAKDRPWRKAPASAEQVAFLNRLRPGHDRLTPERISKGRAGDMITKIKHGARGQFEKIEAGRRRLEREEMRAEQAQALRRREEVQVGPILD